MDDAEFQELLTEIRSLSRDEAAVLNDPVTLKQLVQGMSADQISEFLLTKNIAVFGGVNEYVQDFVKNIRAAKLTAVQKVGQRTLAERLLKQEGLTEVNRTELQSLLGKELAAAAAGGKRWMTRKYCKKTPCRKMGFSQRASCHPYKKCSTRRARRGRVST